MQSQFLTERLILEPIATNDHAFVAELVNTKGWLEFIGDRQVHSKEEAIRYIKKIQNTPDLYYWVVRLKEINTPIGILSFLKRGYLDHFDIGFAFLPSFNGHGYAYEAAKVVLSGAGKNSKHTTVLAVTLPHNSSSIRLLTKLGLHFEKEIVQHNEVLHVYSNQPVR
jgi:[ribosomal protein S5]-alanine N-acetyltransferase